MNISLLQVLNAPLFENVKILSGRAGLGRIVKRASVFDAPFKEDVLEKDILAPGDFFITSLLQFQPKSEELLQVLALRVKGNCSGLCVMMEERAELFSIFLMQRSLELLINVSWKNRQMCLIS